MLRTLFGVNSLFFVFILGSLSGCYKANHNAQNSLIGDNRSTQGIIKSVIQTESINKTYLIAKSSIGPITLGMTLDEARRSFPSATFERISDGDGGAFVSIRIAQEMLMTVYANEDDPQAPIDWSKKITFIEAYSALCVTKNGIYPGLRVLDAEKILGKTKEIQQSEIESREYITFTNQPKALIFRLDYTGIFDEHARKTIKFNPKGKIYSIMISSY